MDPGNHGLRGLAPAGRRGTDVPGGTGVRLLTADTNTPIVGRDERRLYSGPDVATTSPSLGTAALRKSGGTMQQTQLRLRRRCDDPEESIDVPRKRASDTSAARALIAEIDRALASYR